MANIDIEIANRRYNVSCRNGEEDQLRAVAAIVDKRASDAAEALGSLTETRQLLFASLLLADDIRDLRAGKGGGEPLPAPPDPKVGEALERLAERIEALAEHLERTASAS
jgi:cell division protein ZapA